jgi:hypothetical protein
MPGKPGLHLTRERLGELLEAPMVGVLGVGTGLGSSPFIIADTPNTPQICEHLPSL